MSKPICCDAPVNASFNLTYASYLVVPRMVLEAMSHNWQARFVALMEEALSTYGRRDHGERYDSRTGEKLPEVP